MAARRALGESLTVTVAKMLGAVKRQQSWHRPQAQAPESMRQHLKRVMSRHRVTCRAQAGAFVDVPTLQQWLEQGAVTVVDCRGRVAVSDGSDGQRESEYIALRDEYLEGHIPVRTACWVLRMFARLRHAMCVHC